MNTQISTVTTTTTTTGTPALVAAMSNTLAAISDVTPYMLGSFHGECGKACQPSAYYDKDGDQAEYRQGWEEATAPIVAEYNSDYASDIEDRQFWARGSW